MTSLPQQPLRQGRISLPSGTALTHQAPTEWTLDGDGDLTISFPKLKALSITLPESPIPLPVSKDDAGFFTDTRWIWWERLRAFTWDAEAGFKLPKDVQSLPEGWQRLSPMLKELRRALKKGEVALTDKGPPHCNVPLWALVLSLNNVTNAYVTELFDTFLPQDTEATTSFWWPRVAPHALLLARPFTPVDWALSLRRWSVAERLLERGQQMSEPFKMQGGAWWALCVSDSHTAYPAWEKSFLWERAHTLDRKGCIEATIAWKKEQGYDGFVPFMRRVWENLQPHLSSITAAHDAPTQIFDLKRAGALTETARLTPLTLFAFTAPLHENVREATGKGQEERVTRECDQLLTYMVATWQQAGYPLEPEAIENAPLLSFMVSLKNLDPLGRDLYCSLEQEALQKVLPSSAPSSARPRC